MHFGDLARRVFDDFGAANDARVAEPYLLAGRQPEPFLRRVFGEVVALDVELAREGDLARGPSGFSGS
jgi:hypothetical protein